MPILMYTGDEEEITFRNVVFPYGEAVEVADAPIESLYQKLKVLPYFVEVTDETVFEVIDEVVETETEIEVAVDEETPAVTVKGRK